MRDLEVQKRRTNTTGDKVLGRVQLDDAHGAVLPLLGCGGSQELRRHNRLGGLGQSLGRASGDNSLLLRSKRQRSRQKVAEHRGKSSLVVPAWLSLPGVQESRQPGAGARVTVTVMM